MFSPSAPDALTQRPDGVSAAVPELEIVGAEEWHQDRRPLDRPLLQLGRGSGNDIALADAEVSRRHALLQRTEEGGWQLQDLQSHNGSFVFGHRVRRIVLRDGDRLRFGKTRMVFHDADGKRRPPGMFSVLTAAVTARSRRSRLLNELQDDDGNDAELRALERLGKALIEHTPWALGDQTLPRAAADAIADAEAMPPGPARAFAERLARARVAAVALISTHGPLPQPLPRGAEAIPQLLDEAVKRRRSVAAAQRLADLDDRSLADFRRLFGILLPGGR